VVNEPLRIIEPLNRALRHCYNLLKGSPKAPGEPPVVVTGLKAPKKAARTQRPAAKTAQE
jgi:hypothetical protein